MFTVPLARHATWSGGCWELSVSRWVVVSLCTSVMSNHLHLGYTLIVAMMLDVMLRQVSLSSCCSTYMWALCICWCIQDMGVVLSCWLLSYNLFMSDGIRANVYYVLLMQCFIIASTHATHLQRIIDVCVHHVIGFGYIVMRGDWVFLTPPIFCCHF